MSLSRGKEGESSAREPIVDVGNEQRRRTGEREDGRTLVLPKVLVRRLEQYFDPVERCYGRLGLVEAETSRAEAHVNERVRPELLEGGLDGETHHATCDTSSDTTPDSCESQSSREASSVQLRSLT